MNSDLIERLRASMCDENMGCGSMKMCLCATVEEAITALSGPTREEVEKLIGQLRHSRIETVIDKAHDAANLIEQLARNKAGITVLLKLSEHRIKELEALASRQVERTGELTGQVDELLKRAERAERQRDGYLKALKWHQFSGLHGEEHSFSHELAYRIRQAYLQEQRIRAAIDELTKKPT